MNLLPYNIQSTFSLNFMHLLPLKMQHVCAQKNENAH